MAKAAQAKPAKSKPAKSRLKVYQAAFGFYDTVVAAPNQGEALKAWGVRQNLFAEGAARVAEDAEAMEAALAHPGVPLRRALGSKDPFSLDPEPPSLPDAPKRAKPTARKAPDRAALSQAEAAMKAVEKTQAEEAADIERRRRALDDEETQARKRWAHAEEDARRELDKARRAFARAGGHPDA